MLVYLVVAVVVYCAVAILFSVLSGCFRVGSALVSFLIALFWPLFAVLIFSAAFAFFLLILPDLFGLKSKQSDVF